VVHGEEEVDEPATQPDVLLAVCALKVVVWQKVGSCNSITPVSKVRARSVNDKLRVWSAAKCKREILSTTVLLSNQLRQVVQGGVDMPEGSH